MLTSLSQELEEQGRWQLLPGQEGAQRLFERLVRNEFLAPEHDRRLSDTLLSRVVQHAVAEVPYYQALFERLGLAAKDVQTAADLPRLPVLGKSQLQAAGKELQARRLPPGERPYGWFSSSGTTGKPARVMHTHGSNGMFNVLAQRQYRWYRFDPAATFATIRLASQNLRHSDGRLLAAGESLRHERWRYAGKFFATGPHLFFNVENPVEAQLAWLAEQQPDYLQAYSESLEHLAFACDGHWPAPSLKKLMAISEQLTPSMRRRIETTLGAPVEQSYGLNEIGLVAVRCGAGCYHWHVEHCIVEIVDDDGQPCPAGVTGRVVVTALRNPAMPLLRYDTGDLAVAVAGECACGRTLPAFGDIVGRYSRIAYLPPGTLPRVGSLRSALESMPLELARKLRQFQVHQYRDGRFELRLLTAGPLPEGFHRHILAAWQAQTDAGEYPLDIVEVGEIPRSPGGKFQDFTSDYMPLPA